MFPFLRCAELKAEEKVNSTGVEKLPATRPNLFSTFVLYALFAGMGRKIRNAASISENVCVNEIDKNIIEKCIS